uniref:Uncharacterized protein n=1 Tax=Lepeophtheirus salmonis TaxID=72036 RepID=A0A0K2UYY3_LEPSM
MYKKIIISINLCATARNRQIFLSYMLIRCT